ncbi:hypothetical protein ABVT39_006215 [Epinephelus coioides]
MEQILLHGQDPHNITVELFERILKSQVNNHIESMGLIAIHQAGFREGRATTDNILHLSEDIHRNFNKKQITLAIFFNIDKAFNKVWHNGLKFRLLDSNLKLPQSTQSIISNFFSNRQIKVKVASTLSSPFTPQAGVPQDAVLSPLLFADDLCYWSSSKHPQLAAKKLNTCIT